MNIEVSFLGMLVDILQEKLKDLPALTIKQAQKLSAASTILEQDFKPHIVFSDHDVGHEKGPTIFPLIREKNPATFICLMSGRFIKPEEHTADIFLYKGDILRKIDDVLRTRTSTI